MDTTALLQSIGFAAMMCAIAAGLIAFGRKNSASKLENSLVFYAPAALCILIGLGAAPSLYRFNANENSSTLMETAISKTGNKASFTIEHPGVEHTLEIWPTNSPISYETGNAKVKLVDAKGNTLLEKTFDFTTDDYGSNTHGWKHEKETFSPSQAGPVTIQIASMSDQVPGLHLWVKDPRKTDGKRN